MYKNSNVQLTVPRLPVNFQSLLPTNKKLYAPILPAFFRPVCLLLISNVSSFKLLLLRVGKPLFTNGLIVPCVRGMRFRLACFVSPPLSYMKQVPFESAGIRLQNMQKLSVYTAQGLTYILWYANQKIAVDACMCKVSSIIIHPRSDQAVADDRGTVTCQ